jgi:LysR family transcriptional regulator, cys regulon transcriptional activator
MTLQQLKYLLAIADSGLNITSAAERLYTSQPGISKQLKLLEQELGVQLFPRKGKSLTAVTPAGRDVITRARRILREVENIRNLASDLSGEQEGTLAIGTTHTQARHVLPDVIREFRERYPKINLELHQGTSEQIAELVAANRVDFAIATGSRQLFPGLVLLPCYRWDRIILVPNGHPLAGSRNLTLPILAGYPLVTYVFGTSGESSLKKAFADQGLEPNVVFTARDADIIKTYVRMGMGVGIVAPMAYECQDQKDLTAIPATGLFPQVTTWLGFRRDSVLRRYMVDFIALFAPHLTPAITRKAAQLPNQVDVDALFDVEALPLRGGCEENLLKA